MRNTPKNLFRDRKRRETMHQIVDSQIQYASRPGRDHKDVPEYSKWVVFVPYMRYIEPECERKLRHLEQMGISVLRIGGASGIDYVRCQTVSVAMQERNKEGNPTVDSIMFIDADMIFNHMDVVDIFKRPEPVATGVYFQKKFGRMNLNVDDDNVDFGFGTMAPPEGYPVLRTGAGFLRMKVSALHQMINVLNLPKCKGDIWPFFCPFYAEDEEGEFRYYGEDFAFCMRCRAAGIPIRGITKYRCFHIGMYPYSWEEGAGFRIKRVNGLRYNLSDVVMKQDDVINHVETSEPIFVGVQS